MKITQETLEEKNQSVFIKTDKDNVPRKVMYVTSVDLSAKKVSMLVPEKLEIKSEPVTTETDLLKTELPPEVEVKMIPKEETGDIFILNSAGYIVHKS